VRNKNTIFFYYNRRQTAAKVADSIRVSINQPITVYSDAQIKDNNRNGENDAET